MQIVRNIVGASLLWVSVLASHYLAYLIAFPTPAERAHELSHTGHGWLSDVTHYGIPLFVAIIAIGLVVSPKVSNKGRSRNLSLGAGVAFAGVEILERVINSSLTNHPLVFSYETLIVGTALAALFGYVVSALFHEVRVYILNRFAFLRVPVSSDFKMPALSTREIRPNFIQEFLISSVPHRGPPALLNSN